MIAKSQLVQDPERIKKFLDQYRTKLEHAGIQYLGDEPNVIEGGWDTARLRILLVRLSTLDSTRPSMTTPLLYQILHEKCAGVFVDRAYLPEKKDFELFEKNHIPALFGLATKQPARKFDLICITNAIIMENINLPRLLDSSGIDLMFSRRQEDAGCPILLLGGCNVRNVEYLFGDYGQEPFQGTGGMSDAVILGAGENSLPQFVEAMIKIRKEKPEVVSDRKELLRMITTSGVEGLYLPWAYVNIRDDDGTLRATQAIDAFVPEKVKAAVCLNLAEERPLTMDFVSWMGGNGCSDIEISRGCGVGTCNFCQEGMTERPYVQRPLTNLKKWYEEARLYQGSEEAGCYCFNWSSHTEIYELLAWLYAKFGKVGLISNRIDVVSDNKELLKISYQLGNRHWTAGIEGASQRIREALNKEASEEQIVKAIGDAFEIGYTEIKMFFIASGRETEADLVECANMLQKICDVRSAKGSKAFVRLSFTPLFGKSFTPLQWQECLPGLNLGEDTLRPIVIKCRELGFGFRTSCKRSEIRISNLLEQGDRRITSLLIESSLKDDFIYYGNVPKTEPEKWTARLDKLGLSWNTFFNRKPKDHVFAWDHLDFHISRDFLWRRYEMWMNYEEELTCMGHRKLKEVDGEVQLKADGTPDWELVKGKCSACKACPDGAHIKGLMNAAINGVPLKDVFGVQTLRSASHVTKWMLRFKIEIDPPHSGVAKNIWPRVLARAFMLSNKFAPEAFNKAGAVTMTRLADEEKQPIFGVEYADLGMVEPVPAHALDLKKIQAECPGIKILGVADGSKLAQFRGNVFNLYSVQFPDDFDMTMNEIADAFVGVDDRVFELRKFIAKGKGGKEIVRYKMLGADLGRFWLMKNKKVLAMRVSMEIDPFQVLGNLLEMKRHRILGLELRSHGAFRFMDRVLCDDCGSDIRIGMLGETLSCECKIESMV